MLIKNNSFEEWVVCIFTNGFSRLKCFGAFKKCTPDLGCFPFTLGDQLVHGLSKW